MRKKIIQIENIPAILYGPDSDKLYIYIHGKYSKKEEAEPFANIAIQNGYQIISFDLPEHGQRKGEKYACNVQNVVLDLEIIYSYFKNQYKVFSLFACSLGAYFSLIAYQNIQFEKCLFLSPILDMERLIQNMMKWANVSEEELKEKEYIETSFDEKLSWGYYQYVRNHPIKNWTSKTYILYGENDNMTERSILDSFVKKYNCNIDIMKEGEHYFHTSEQIIYLENWVKSVI